jgi:hypothetical protein
MKSITAYICPVVICFLIQGASAQWSNAVLDTLTDNQVDDNRTSHSFVMGSDGTLHLTYYRNEGISQTVYRVWNPSTGWSPEEYPLTGSEDIAMASLPKNVRPDSVWMMAKYGLSLLLFQRDAGGNWTFDSITPPDVNVGSSDMAAAVDSNGRWHVVFIYGLFGGGFDLYYGMYNGSDFEWQALNVPLGPYGSGAAPELVVEDNGVVHIFYRVLAWTYEINHAWNDSAGGHEWQIEPVSNANMDNYTTKAVWSREYGLCVAISGDDGFGMPGRIYYHEKPPESGWQPPELATGTYSAINGQLTLDSWGNPMIVWEQTSGNILTGNIFYSVRTQQWDTFGLFENGISYDPQVLMDSEDNGCMIFSTEQYPDDSEIHYFGPESQSAVSSSKVHSIPASIVLHPIYPNPMNTSGTVTFSLPSAQDIRLGIFNIMGQKVRTLMFGHYTQGNHRFDFDVGDLASGYYLVILETPEFKQTQPVVILK